MIAARVTRSHHRSPRAPARCALGHHSLLALLCAAALGACEATATAEAERPAPTGLQAARYYLVGAEGVRTRGPNPRTLAPGFGVMIVGELMLGAERMGRTPSGGLLPLRALRPVAPSSFSGVTLTRGELDFGWTGPDEAYIWPRPQRAGRPSGLLRRHQNVRMRSVPAPAQWLAVEGGFVEARALHVPSRSTRPREVASDERWLDVELSSQTLVAYEGDQPRFATLVSTGIGRPGTAFETPRGLHRIETKWLSAPMDNLEHTGVIPYAYADVPYTQYIGRIALHGTFWHDRFGTPTSHGCINVSLQDAQHLFAFTSPRLPPGETQISARSRNAASPIRVR